MTNYKSILRNFLPPQATILTLPQSKERPAVLLADIDGDYTDELIVAYRYEEQNYLLVLKMMNNQWLPHIHIRGNGYGISDLMVAPITTNGVNTLIIGWQVGSEWAELDLMQWKNGGFVQLLTKNFVYSKLEVEDMPGKYGPDGQYEIAVWTHDTGDAYKVEVYRFEKNGLVLASDVYPYYLKKVEDYYKRLLQKNDFSYYWYYLADAQLKAGYLKESLTTLNHALTFSSPYPSRDALINIRQGVVDRLDHAITNDQVVITLKRGDITGDGLVDTVYLTGEKTEDSPYWKNIALNFLEGKTNRYEKIPLKESEGYNPTIFLGDLTKNHLEDILIVVDTGGSGGIIIAYVFSYVEGKLREVFDVNTFNERSKYDVNYQIHYQVSVTSIDPKKEYILDLMYKGQEYLSDIYAEDGVLFKQIEGWVDPVSGLYPVDFARDGNYELMAFQKIAGRYHADGLGYVQNILTWNGHKFVTDRQMVSIVGEDLS